MDKEIRSIISLQNSNRYNIPNFLRFIEEKDGLLVYKFCFATADEEEIGMRVIAGENDSFEFPSAIDPSGGPYMHVGFFCIEGLKLKSIEFKKGVGYFLSFEPMES